MINLKLSEKEAQQLAELLDIATKAGGVGVARASLPIFEKLMEATEANKLGE